MKKKKVYISGKISGLDAKEAKQAFDKAEAYAIKLGYNVVNPMALPTAIQSKITRQIKTETDDSKFPATSYKTLAEWRERKIWQIYMREDIKLLADCNIIVLLDNWHVSEGASIELKLALDLGLEVSWKIKDLPKNDNI